MTVIDIERLHEDFGAQVNGINFAEALSQQQVDSVLEAIDEFSFLLFPKQDLDDGIQLELTRRLGEPEPNHARLGRDGVIDYFGTVGNVREDGTSVGNAHEHTKHMTGNNMWHTDSSFRKVPSFVSINYAYEVPEEGGETQYTSARSAYSRLSNETKRIIDPLLVVHDYVYSRSKVAKVKESHAKSLPPVQQKLVRTNKNNGKKNYYAGAHAREVVGWDRMRGRQLLDELTETATVSEHTYTHCWKPRDLVIWDNRCLLHRGLGYDADKYRRRMRQTRVAGVGPTADE